jgi:hypothetical protein
MMKRIASLPALGRLARGIRATRALPQPAITIAQLRPPTDITRKPGHKRSIAYLFEEYFADHSDFKQVFQVFGILRSKTADIVIEVCVD